MLQLRYPIILPSSASSSISSAQVRFALSSSATFTRSDTITDSERFYNSILQFLEDADEKNEVDVLLVWWNRQVQFATILC
jgi:hypothetical protein